MPRCQHACSPACQTLAAVEDTQGYLQYSRAAHHEGLHIPQIVLERQVAVVQRLKKCVLGALQVSTLLLGESCGICWRSSYSSRSPCCQCSHLQHAEERLNLMQACS